MNRWVLTALAGWLAAAGVAPAQVRDQDVERRIAVLRQALLDRQGRDGSWAGYDSYSVGLTSLCLLALVQAEVPADHPGIKKAARYVLNNTDAKVYSEALAAVALAQLDPVLYQARLARASAFLASCQVKDGGWSYDVFRNRIADNSNTQFAILGLAAGAQGGTPIGADVRAQARQHWLQQQNADGSWGYAAGLGQGSPSMTLAGIASLHLLGERFERRARTCGDYEYHRNLAAALKWMAGSLRRGDPAAVFASGHAGYGLYALERVAIFLGIKDLGGLDWYRWGATWLLAQDPANLGPADQAFALLFLAKGKAAVAIAKWHWSGDWNNQHADAQNWCQAASRELGRPLDWLPATLDGLDSPAAKASLIWVNGREEFTATPAELEFLRAFLDDGGTLAAEVTCDDQRFVRSFQKVLQRELYPDLSPSFVPITAQHPVCWLKRQLPLADVMALEFRAGCKRLNVLLLLRNISGALNGDADAQPDLPRAEKVAVNLLAWALENRRAGGKLDLVTLKESPPQTGLTADQVERTKATTTTQLRQPFARLKHNGNWQAAPRYFAVLDELLRQRDGLPRFDGEVYANARDNDLFQSAIVFVTGYGDPGLKEEAAVSLRAYLQHGGFVFGVNACSSKEFDAGFRRLVQRVLPNDQLEEVPPAAALFRQPFDLSGQPAQGTKAYAATFGQRWAPLLGVRREGRWVLVYSPVDLCSDVAEGLHDSVVGYRRESGARLSVNVLYQALRP